jgi:uncharacterized membrane protein YbaN (DUF454 family)
MKNFQSEPPAIELSHSYSSRQHVMDRPGVITATRSVSVLRRAVYLFLAGVFFVLAMAGVILPGLPTTPFLLLTSYFLVRSYPRLNERLLKSKLFGPVLFDWQVKGGVRRDVKAKAISVVFIAIGFSVYLTQFSLVPSLIVSASAAIGIFVILKLPEPRA